MRSDISDENGTASVYPPRRVRDFSSSGRNIIGAQADCEEWIIFYPSQPYDDDVYVVYWDRDQRKWLWRAGGFGPFGKIYDQLDADKTMILLEYFDLLDQADKYLTQSLVDPVPPKAAAGRRLVNLGPRSHRPPAQIKESGLGSRVF